MDTNLKNSNDRSIKITEDKKTKINFYSSKLKLLYLIIALMSLIILFLSLSFKSFNEPIYNNDNIENDFARYSYNLVDAKLNLKSEENIIEFYETSYNKLAAEDTTDVLLTDTYPVDSDTVSIQIPEAPTAKNYDREYTNNKIKQRIADFNDITNDLESTVNFTYVIMDTEKNQIVDTNISKNPNVTKPTDLIGLLESQEYYISFINGKASGNLNNSLYWDIEELIKKTGTTQYSVYCAIIEPITLGLNGEVDTFYLQNTVYAEIAPSYRLATTLIPIMVFVLLIALCFLALFVGRSEKYGKVTLWKIDKLYFDVHTLLVLFFALISIRFLALISIRITIFGKYYYTLGAILIFLLGVSIGLNYFCSFCRQIKSKTLIKNTLLYRIFKNSKTFFIDIIMLLKSSQKYGVIFFISVITVLCFLNAYWYLRLLMNTNLYSSEHLLFLITLFLNLMFVVWLIVTFVSINKIKVATKEISSGNVNYTIKTNTMTGTVKALAEDIANIQSGLTNAVAEAIKGERLKTELITNVSHDLKTPLTSIINYVDLLKKEDLKNENAVVYVHILEEKSARLKQLIEDLVEASKASSGNISVALEKVDLHQLMLQSCGEYGEKLSKSNLDVKINFFGNGTIIAADGKLMWRVIENLLSNITKYAQPHSRVYVDITQNTAYGLLTIKNISRDPLDISPEELTQRFVRGDSARTTEGSGLGLSISQSLTNLQGGNFNVFIDGDLFKVVIEMPLWV